MQGAFSSDAVRDEPVGARTAIAVVEAAYGFDGDDRGWLERLLAIAAPDLDRGAGIYATTGVVRAGHLLPAPPMARHRLSDELARLALALHPRLPCPILDRFATRAVVCGGLDEGWGKRHGAAAVYRAGLGSAGVTDALVVFAQDGEVAVKIVAPSRGPVLTHPRTRAVWGRVAQHLVSALRLRWRAREDDAALVARVSPEGRLVAPEGIDARTASRIARAVRTAEEARSMRDDPDGALSLWVGLLAGRYSVVDRWEDDGTRYVAVYRNDPKNPDPRALGASEHHVAELVALGASLKEAAYALGIGADAAQKALASALRKLGLARSSELVAFFKGQRRRATVRVGSIELDVLAASSKPRAESLAALTSAERAVAEAVMRGLANAAIAKQRGTSTRTVANQVRRVFDKLGVRSRGELRARLAS